MTTVSERLALLLSIDADGAIRSMESFGRRSKSELESTEDRISRLANRSLTIGAGMVAASAVAGRALFALGQDAVRAEQAASAVQRQFGSASEAVLRFAEGADEAAGLSEQAANQIGAVLGAGLQGLGFEADAAAAEVEKLTVRAADMAAVFGGSTQEAIDAVSSLLRGERDPIERYGVAIKQVDVAARVAALGLDTSTAAAQKNAEAIAALELFYEQSAASAGAFGESTAGEALRAQASFENLRAELGEAVVPALAKGAEAFSSLVGAVSAANEATGGAVGQILAYGTAATGVVGGITVLTGAVLKARAALQATGSFLAGLNPLVLGLSTVAAVGAAVWVDYAAGQQQAAERAQDLQAALEDTEASVRTLADAVLAQDSFRDSAETFADLGLSVEQLIPAIELGTDKFGELERIAGDSRVSIEELREQFADAAPATRALADELLNAADAGEVSRSDLRRLFESLDEAADSFDDARKSIQDEAREKLANAAITGDLTSAQRDLLTAQVESATTAAELTDAVSAVNAALADQESGARGLSGALDAMRTATRLGQIAQEGAEQAADDHREALQRLRDEARRGIDAVLDYERSLLDSADAVDRVRQAEEALNAEPTEERQRDVERATLAAAEAALRQAEDFAAAQGATEGSTTANSLMVIELGRIAKTLAPGSDLRRRIEQYIAALDGVPSSISTSVQIDTERALRDVGSLGRRLSDTIALIRILNGGGLNPTPNPTSTTNNNVTINAQSVNGESITSELRRLELLNS